MRYAVGPGAVRMRPRSTWFVLLSTLPPVEGPIQTSSAVCSRRRSSASEAARSAHARFAGLTSGAESQASLMTETCARARGDTTIPGRAACCLAEAFSANLSRKPQSASTLPMFTICLLYTYYLFTSFGIIMVRVRR